MQQAPQTDNPYAAPQASVQPLLNAQSLTLASRGTRLAAVLLDGLMYGVLILPVIIATPDKGGELSIGATLLVLLAALGVLALFVYNLILLNRSGQTLAKRWLGIRIVRSDGSDAGLGRVFGLRMLLPGVIGAIPLLGGLFSLADALFIFGSEKRCIHDYMADTIVVDA